jgi:hypothetical protein
MQGPCPVETWAIVSHELAATFSLLGPPLDNDLKLSPNAVLTQAMILVSIEPTGPDVATISIPRDFWVPIAGYGYQKIDVAYEVGGIALAAPEFASLGYSPDGAEQVLPPNWAAIRPAVACLLHSASSAVSAPASGT